MSSILLRVQQENSFLQSNAMVGVWVQFQFQIQIGSWIMPTHSGSLKVFLMCSPRPYKLGFFGRTVLISKYWSENCTAVEKGERERERERELY